LTHSKQAADEAHGQGRLGSLALLLIGLNLVRITVTRQYERYVRPDMRPWLLSGGLTIVGLVLVHIVVHRRRQRETASEQTASGQHAHHGWLTWLLIVPVLFLLWGPPALGSWSADRTTTPVVPEATYAPLTGPTSIPLWEFDARAQDRGGVSFAGKTATLTGFVAGQASRGPMIARFQILCCAADALRSQARLIEPGATYEPNTWLRVRELSPAWTLRGSP
jgi:uncharacterized repeat protein (TIGR03943 family)